MGGKSQSYVVGYKYYLGMHTVACAAPVDGCSAIWFNDREAWKGNAGASQIEVNAKKLFGGKQREGGVAGYIDYLHGEPTQDVNDYLRQVLFEGSYSTARANGAYAVPTYNPGLVSALRGTSGHVFRKFYWGNNPYIKPMRQRWHNVLSTYPDYAPSVSPPTLGEPGSWEPLLAPICQEFDAADMSIYVAFDNSGSFASPSGKSADARAAFKVFLDSLSNATGTISLRIQTFINAVAGASFERIPFTSADVAAAKSFIDGLPTPSGLTNFGAATDSAPQFYLDAETALLGTVTSSDYTPALSGTPTDRVEDVGVASKLKPVMLFISDGIPTFGDYTLAQANINQVPGIEVYAFAFDTVGELVFLDNTPQDGVPLITASNYSALSAYLQTPFRTWGDLNAAHILRDVLINPIYGGSGEPNDIGTTFATVAQTFFNEGMGLSFLNQNPRDRASFRELVEQHAGCVTYLDRTTGLWEIKAIRPDYTLGSLHTFDSSNIVEWISHEKPQQFELPNHITLVYTRRDNGEPISISDTNSAALQIVGTLIPDKVKMEGITCPALAAKVLQRELVARTVPWRAGKIRVSYCPADLNLGDAFIINEPRLGIQNEVARVVEIEETDGRDNSIIIDFSQDVFEYDPAVTPASASTDQATTGSPTTVAQPSTTIFFEELAYYDQVLVRGQSAIDSALVTDADVGNWHITGNAFDSFHVTGDYVRDDGTAWVNVGTTTLMPTWVLSADLAKNPATGTSFQAAATGREAELQAGQIIQIGSERMRLDSVSVSSGVATFSVGRAVLDTVPAAHSSGDVIMAWFPFTAGDGIDYTGGDVVDVRFLPSVFGNTLNINNASTQTLNMNSRAVRPYPVGQLQVDGEYEPAAQKSGNVSVTWVHRDRLQQTSQAIIDHTDATMGPESGVSYHLVRRWIENNSGVESVGHTIETALSPAQGTSTTVDVNAGDMAAYITANTIALEIGIKSKHTISATEYENFQTPFVRVFVAAALSAPFNLQGTPV